MSEEPTRVVILGAGFGGLSAARGLAGAALDVTLIDRQNYHLFQPLLYQVATAALSPAEIAWPIRRLTRGQENLTVLMGEVAGIDREAGEVVMPGRRVPYDRLVVATGATDSYFGNDEWAPYAPGLKTVTDATMIRRRMLLAFERAEAACDDDEREALMTFAIVGGGPTGVELAGAIIEVAHRTLAADFRHIDPRQARVVLIEAGPRVLGAFPEALSEYAAGALEDLGVELRLETRVTACGPEGVELGDESLPARTVIWAAGVQATPVADWLGVEADRGGRIAVDEHLNLPGSETVYVIGDCASALDAGGEPLPGVAPVAKQQGRYVAKRLRAEAGGRAEDRPFRYRDWGNLATIGRRSAVVDWGRLRLRGWPAWWLWGGVHIYFLINLRSRLIVALQWLWAYLTFDRGARLITEQARGPGEPDATESPPQATARIPEKAGASAESAG